MTLLREWVSIMLSHGENRGSSPLGSANDINDLHFEKIVSVPSVSRRNSGLASVSRRICLGQEGLGARQKASHGLDSSIGGLTV